MVIDMTGRVYNIEHQVTRHTPSFGGMLWFVSKTGHDSNPGQTPTQPFLTIGAAITAASAGDAITIKAGTYAENVVMSLDSLELWCEIGTVIAPNAGVALTVSGDNCRVRGELWITAFAGSDGVDATGNYVNLFEVIVIGGANGFDVSGAGSTLRNCRAGQQTVAGFAITGSQGMYYGCNTVGVGATYGFRISGNASTGVVVDCTSTGHTTAGFSIASGSEDWTIKDGSSGAGDGDRVDSGTHNLWPGFFGRSRRQLHEHICPVSAGEGAAGDPVTVSNSTTDGGGGARDDQDYWGDIAVIVAPAAITSAWDCLGLYIHGNTAADIQQWQTFFTTPAYSSAQNGGNDWDENETILTVADGTVFQTDDFVWITGDDRTAGEILKVSSVAVNAVTVVRETTADGEAGLRYIYDVAPGNNTMYLVYRPTDLEFHGYDGDFEIDTTRAGTRYDFARYKRIVPNGGMIMRMLNATDAGASSFDVRVIYMD